MRVKDIAKQYGFDLGDANNIGDFERFILTSNKIEFSSGFWGMEIEDRDVPKAVELYKALLEKKKLEEEAKKEAEEINKRRRTELPEILITSGFSFDGYTIKKYSGYISGDDATTIPRYPDSEGPTANSHGQNLTHALVKIRRQALYELKEAAFDLGCNAVIGVDFDYIVLQPQTMSITGGTRYEDYVICVTANGNAVVIEKNPE